MDHSERYISVDSRHRMPLDRESVSESVTAITTSLGGHSRAFAARFRPLLARASFRYWLTLTVVLCLLPTLRTGLVFDDVFHRLEVAGRFGSRLGPLDLFDFIPHDPAQRRALQEHGFPAWWLGPDTQVSYFRPLASLTHYLDYSRWPDAHWLMHLESVLWYAGVVLASAAFYRRFIDTRWMIGFATVLYAFDHSHAGPVAWLANRSALMATLFGVLCVVAHDRWRRAGRRLCAPLAWMFFALALLSAESGIAIGGYLVAHALFIDRDSPLRRGLAVLPYAVVAAGWRLAYTMLGHGVIGSGINADPLRDPLAFAVRALRSIPVLIGADLTALPCDALLVAPRLGPFAGVAAAAFVVVFVVACWPLVRSVPTSRFFAAGALLSTIPFGGMLATDRYLFWTGLGVMGLLAQAAGMPGLTFRSRPARWLCVACLSMRFAISPVLFPIGALGPSFWRAHLTPLVATFPSGPEVAQQTIVLVDAPSELAAAYLPITSAEGGGVLPAHVYLLHSGLADVQLARTGPRSLEMTAPRGWMPAPMDRTLRASPFHVGEDVALARMDASVRSVLADGRAGAVAFAFPVDLEDRSLQFLVWGQHGLERFSPPPVGRSVTVSAPPLLTRKD